MLLKANVTGELHALEAVVNLAYTELVPNREIAGVKGWKEIQTDDGVQAIKLASYIGSDKKEWNLFPVIMNEKEITEILLRWLETQDKQKLPRDKMSDGYVFGFQAEISDNYPSYFLMIKPVLIGIGK